MLLDPTWNRKLVDHDVCGGEVVPVMSDDDDDDDSDDEGNTIHWPRASQRSVRQAESLEGPYSLLSLPLPSDAPDSGRKGSDRDSPGKSSQSAAAGQSLSSLDQRLDELFEKGTLGDWSPPSSASDRRSDIESDSLSEEELDIIKLRKPVTVTLQPGLSRPSHSATASQPKSSEPESLDRKSSDDGQEVASREDDAAPLSDDMVDEIVRMKPMMAKAARKPSLPAAVNIPQDLSLKSLRNMPVDLSSKPPACSSENVSPPVSSNPMSSTASTPCTSVSDSTAVDVGLPIPTISSQPRPYYSRRSEETQCVQSRAPEMQSSQLPDDVWGMNKAFCEGPENIGSLMTSPSLPVPSFCSVQQHASVSAIDILLLASSDIGSSGFSKGTSDQPCRQPVTNAALDTASRYC